MPSASASAVDPSSGTLEPASAEPSAGASNAPGASPSAAATAPAPAGQPADDPPEADRVATVEDEVAEEYAVGEDDAEPPPAVTSPPPRPNSPQLSLSDAEIAKRLRQDPTSLGSMSIGRPSAGALYNGVRLPKSELWERIDPGNQWATQETIDYLERAVRKVHEQFPDTPVLYVGHLSAKRGGHLKPHRSHQSGRDVDTSFYYGGGKSQRWYRRANAENLDLPRTWAFVRALVVETDVQYIFINHSVQKLIKGYALEIGEDPDWLDRVFQYKSRRPGAIVRHAPGHDTHIHVRFYNPVAQNMGRRAYGSLVKMGKIKPPTYYVRHRARKGDTLGALARKYGTTVPAIQAANGLRSSRIYAKRVYRIPRKGQVAGAPGPIAIPPRKLPPEGTPRKRLEAAGGAAAPASTAAP